VIARKNRFHGHNSVSKVRGSTVYSPLLSIRYEKNNKNDYRLAVVVSKKVDGHAVVRNRIRRRIYEIFRKQEKLNNLPINVVVYAKNTDLATMPHEKLAGEIEGLTNKVIRNFVDLRDKRDK
jgi:ribonuclease P protein component